MSELHEPEPDYVNARINDFDNDLSCSIPDKVIATTFAQWPANTDYETVLIKVKILNLLYSTNIYDVSLVAEHIQGLSIDSNLTNGGAALINKIADLTFRGGKKRRCYSFATKYCSAQQPDHYQIFDSRVEWLLRQYRKQFKFFSFHTDDLREYSKFVEVVDQLKERFKLKQFGPKAMDKFLYYEAYKMMPEPNA